MGGRKKAADQYGLVELVDRHDPFGSPRDPKTRRPARLSCTNQPSRNQNHLPWHHRVVRAGTMGMGLWALLGVAGTSHPTLANTTWTNATGNSMWSDSGNWSNGQPDGFENLTIMPSPVPGFGTITLNPSEFVDEIRFDTGGYTLTGGDLFLLSGLITANGGGANPTIASQIKGLAGLTKLGNRALNLQGNNTYSGPTEVQENFLDVSGASERLPDSTVVIVNSGTGLRFFLGAGTETIGRLVGLGDVIFANSNAGGTNLRVGSTNVDHVFEGNLIQQFGGTGKLTKIGTAQLTLTGNNSYTGGTVVSDGTLVVNTTSLPAAGGVANSDVLIFDQGFDGTYAGVISGGGSLFKQGTGVLDLSQTNTYTGGTRLEAGTVAISADANLGAATSPVAFAGGTLRFNTGVFVNFSSNRPFNIALGSDARFEPQADAIVNINSAITGLGGLIKDGPGSVALLKTSTYTGPTTINAGRLFVSGDGEVIPDASAVTVNAGGSFEILSGRTETIGSLTGAGAVKIFSSTTEIGHLRVGANNTNTTFSGNITDGSIFEGGKLTKIGTGILTLTGHNTYTGGTVVDFADFQGGLVVTTNSLPAAGGVQVEGAVLFQQDFDGTYAGVISGTGGVDKSGTGTLTLNQTNTYTLATGISAGTLAVSSDANLGAANALVAFNGGALRTTNSGPLSFAESRVFLIFSGDAVFDTQGTGQVELPGGVGQLSPSTDPPGGLVKNGPGTLNLSTTSANYTSSTIINQGQLGIKSNEILPDTTDVIINGGFLSLVGGVTETIDTLSGSGGPVVFTTAPNNHLILGADNGSATFSGAVFPIASGSGRLTKTGTGTQTFVGTEAFAKTVDVTALHVDQGQVTLDGAKVDVAGQVRVGNAQTAAVVVRNGATVSIDSGVGALDSQLFVGVGGDGTLTVESGGQVSVARETFIAQNPGSTGTVTVTGTGSTLTTTRLDVGGDSQFHTSGGSATLTIGPGATVHVTQIGTKVWDNDTINLNGGTLITSILDLTAPGAKLNVNGGTLKSDEVQGDTTISDGSFSAANVTGSLTQNGGAVTPGNSPGITAISEDYFFNAGSIQIELAGTGGPGTATGHDLVTVGQMATLAGSIDVTFLDGFTPNYGDTFTILTADTIAGAFSNRGEFIDAIDFTIAGQAPGVFRLGTSNFALVPLLELDPSGAGGGDDTVTLITTAPGDLNLDGTVNIGDFLIFQNNFNGPGNWFDGDFNGDGLVNIGDFLLLQNNFNDVFFTPSAGASGSGLGGAEDLALLADFTATHGAGPTPEPTTVLLLMGLGTSTLLARRRSEYGLRLIRA